MFGTVGNGFLEILKKFPLTQLNKKYSFVDNEEFKKTLIADFAKGNKIYWYEMLMRSHLAASTAILRGRRWLDGIVSSVNENNLLTFAAALRGFIESSADAQTSLVSVPMTLARNYQMINKALLGQVNEPFICKELEDALIHYSHARKPKKGEAVPETQKAMKVTEYMEILLKADVPQVIKCYARLCDLTHPGATSVWMWLEGDSDLEFRINLNQDRDIIKWFLAEYELMFPDIFMQAFNGSILTLALLNLFSIAEYHTPALKKWNFSNIPAWKNIQKAISESRQQF